MSLFRTTLVTLVATLSAAPCLAQPSLVKTFDAWGVYSIARSDNTVCYVLTIPNTMTPSHVNHGSNYLIVARAPGTKGHWVPQARFGYNLDEERGATARVGGKTFRMTSRGDTAWTLKEKREGELVAAMRLGSSLIIEATSQRGTETRYAFSLDGVTAALKRAANCD